MFYDLNVPWTNANDPQLTRTLHFLHELGYNVVALNYMVSGKLPAELTNPIPQPAPLPNLPASLRILTRVTITLSPDVPPPSNARLSALSQTFNLLALRPTDEKTLSQACGSLECAIVSLDLTQRYPFWFRHKMLNEAVGQGKKVEICYAQALGPAGGAAAAGGAQEVARRNLIANATQLVRATRGRGVLICSEARRALHCRAPWDVVNLGVVWGLPQDRGVEGMGREARACVVNAELRKESYRGVVGVVYGGEKGDVEGEKGAGLGESRAKALMGKSGKRSGENGVRSGNAGLHTEQAGAVMGGTKRKSTTDDGAAAEQPMSKRQVKRLRKEAKAQGTGKVGKGEDDERDVSSLVS